MDTEARFRMSKWARNATGRRKFISLRLRDITTAKMVLRPLATPPPWPAYDRDHPLSAGGIPGNDTRTGRPLPRDSLTLQCLAKQRLKTGPKEQHPDTMEAAA